MYRHNISKRNSRGHFAELVSRVVRNIPQGRVVSYGEVAEKAGFPRAARAVGTVMKNNLDPNVPCHRIICADERVGDYNRGRNKKVKLLIEEGVQIISGRVVKKSN